jgi:homoserine dehydrogenase
MVGGGMAPPNPVLTANRNTGTADYGLSQASQQQQHFNSTYSQNVGGGMPGGMMSFEPMAANEVIGSKF